VTERERERERESTLDRAHVRYGHYLFGAKSPQNLEIMATSGVTVDSGQVPRFGFNI